MDRRSSSAAQLPKLGMPSVFDPSFKGAGQRPGLEIWRVEKLAVVKKDHKDKCYEGQLYEGDSYILLHTRERNNALERNIYFWIGKDSSQDEYGVAAYKTVELDESLGGEPVQHRETQFNETAEFLSLFKTGVRYLEGGVATGFKHVDRDSFTTRLLHIKGRRTIRTLQVPLEPSSLNDGDVFILDAGRDIFQWNGKDASKVEKSKGLEITRKIRDEERSGVANIHILESGVGDDSLFWSKFGKPKPGKIKSAADGGDDEAHTHAAAANIQLYRVSDSTGKVKVEPVGEKPYKREHLDTNDAFILDMGPAGIFVWIGKGATREEKAQSMKFGTDFIAQKKYPSGTPVTRVVEGGETPIFKQVFENWPEPTFSNKAGGPRKPTAPKPTFDAKTMHLKAEREKARLVDDGSGKLEVYRIEDFEMAAWPRDKYGHFYGGDSYVMLYTYLQNSKECYIIYFWQGLKSSQDEKGASALHAKGLDDKYGGAPVQVRVVQNKEPAHFYLVMKKYGGMVVHEGGRASGFKNVNDQDRYDTDGTRLFQVKGSNDYNTRAIQVPEKASSLNSGDVFVLETPGSNFLWFGKGCTGDEREFAKSICKTISPKPFETIMEGTEPKEFWAAIGGKAPYAENKVETTDEIREPRLFQCSNVVGHFKVEEIFDFDQEDLIEDDVMILDTYFEVFVWLGKGANLEEKKEALKAAEQYVASDTSGRKVDDTVMIQIKQGFEPPNFTSHFIAWDADKWSKGKTYEELKAELASSGKAADLGTNVKAALNTLTNIDPIPYERLISGEALPEGVDLLSKENYLSEAEFVKVLGVPRSEFAVMPKWKQANLKKKVKLF